MVLQVKSAHELAAPVAVAAYAVRDGAIEIDGRSIPVIGAGPLDAIAHGFARVPAPLRALLQTLAISPTDSPYDAYFQRVYKLHVVAGMGTDFFVKNFMHELGHAWSRPAWRDDATAAKAWRDAIAADPDPPSGYARDSFRNAGAMDEDAAEATALYFLMRGTADEARYRGRMPARFALLDARFPR